MIKRRKLFPIFMAAIMSLAYVAVIEPVYAGIDDINIQSDNNGDYDSNGLVIQDGVLVSGTEAEGEVIIPSTVSKIQAEAFRDNSKITSVKISGEVIDIGDEAFYNCDNLKNVVIENGVECIGDSAFGQCKIKSISIPESVENIMDYAFARCPNLKSVKFKEGTILGISVFNKTPWLDNIEYKDGYKIYKGHLLKADVKLTGNIVIPDGVTEICGGAFWQNTGINNVKISDGVRVIGDMAFYECPIEGYVSIPSSVKIMSQSSFGDMNSSRFDGAGADTAKYAPEIYMVDREESVNEECGTITFAECADEDSAENINQGWSLVDGKWYYKNTDGNKTTGWLNYNGKWYYFYNNGQMATGFIQDDNNVSYYLDESTDNIGVMQNGWKNINGEWYYFNTANDKGIAGMMKKGWSNIGGKWYYFNEAIGVMVHDTYVNGYYVNSNGEWTK